MKITFYITIVIVLAIGCHSSDQQPKEKAERLAQRAYDEISRNDYEEAERLLAECVDIHAESNNQAKLAETYATLSSAQILAGKITPTLETLAALRDLYRYAADRTAELHVMFQMARLEFQLGNSDEAIHLLHDAFTSSTLYRLENLHAIAGLEAGKLLNLLHRYSDAVPYLTAAQKYYSSTADIPQILETTGALIAAHAALKQTDAAYTEFQKMESLFASSDPSLNRPQFYNTVGDAFLETGDPAFARANYLQVLSILNQNDSTNSADESIHALIGLGELYFTNFSFPEAQQYFISAYTVAKKRSLEYLQAYLLTRISDCLLKVSIYHDSKDGLIRASQLYEQSQTLFARMGFGLGEAIATHRQGFLKELSGDESAAITFYKRAIEKYLNNAMLPVYYTLAVPVEALYTTPSGSPSANEWFSDRLISLLLKYKRFPEALAYHATMRSVELQKVLKNSSFNFRDPEKRARYSEFTRGLDEKFRIQLELFHVKNNNKSYASKLQQRLKYIRSKVESDAVTLIREYPVFSYIGFLQQSLQLSVDSRIESASIVLDYCEVNNEIWVFVLRPNQELTAYKLSSEGNSRAVRMRQFVDGLQNPTFDRTVMQQLSGELYSFLLKPLEIVSNQRIIIIPPVHFPTFPFHALSNAGISMAETNFISYLPHLSFINANAHIPRFVNNVIGFGFTPDFRWGLEFELRDTRSFFKNTHVYVNQSATQQKLESALGEILQISSQFSKSAQGDYSFILSDGSASKLGTPVPIEVFTSLHPFQIVYLSDVQSSVNNISQLHPLLWMLNGSAAVVATQFPITSTISKIFSENFYSSLSMEINPSLAYRRAEVQLGKRGSLREGFGGASYFYYGIK